MVNKIASERIDGGFDVKLRQMDIAIFVLDDSWPEDAQTFLYESGADLIVTFQTFHELAPFPDEILEVAPA